MKRALFIIFAAGAGYLGLTGSVNAWGPWHDHYHGGQGKGYVGYYPHGGPVYAYYRKSPACDFPFGHVGGPYVGVYGFPGSCYSQKYGFATPPVRYPGMTATCCRPSAHCCIPSMGVSACCVSARSPMSSVNHPLKPELAAVDSK